MAFTPTSSLSANTSVLLKDYQHAARTFVDDQFRLLPKQDFSFHVAFGINTSTVKDIELLQRHGTEINMLVKNITFPKFTVGIETINQYNRKKVIQNNIKYEHVTIKFHDDNMSLINFLWRNYYSYYYADSSSAKVPGAYNKTATRKSDFITTAYGLDNGSIAPFFNYITLYQMARHEYVSVKLINPMIVSFDGSPLDYSSSKSHEFTMVLAFESVVYDNGNVSPDSVEGFGTEHYDTSPSPLQPGTGNTGSESPTFVTNAPSNNSPAAILALLEQVNKAQNTRQPTTTAPPSLLTAKPDQRLAGLQGFDFPTSPTSTAVVATSVKL